MPDQAPAATENTPVQPNDADTAATVLTGSEAPAMVGGGGLGPRSGANPIAGAGAAMGTAPNAAIDITTPDLLRAEQAEPEEPRANRQAKLEQAHDNPTAPDKAPQGGTHL